ncbi:hypothetical protein QUA56_13845 [Microcoleus sp. N3A4]|uniref:hypothetical protein n=1 Tax=Microcoleus sp. N3A4 TaxID=3055379 RepID=UPI002FCFCCD7
MTCCNLDRKFTIASVICGIVSDRLSAGTHKRTGVKNQRRQTPKAATRQQLQQLLAVESPAFPVKAPARA